MAIYYRGPDAVITDELFEVQYPYQRYRISELSNMEVVRCPFDPVIVRSAHVGGLTTVLVAGSWPWLTTPNAWLIAGMLVVTPLATGCGLCRWRPRGYELRATYRRYRVLLYGSSDARTFEQIRRALVRATERYEMARA